VTESLAAVFDPLCCRRRVEVDAGVARLTAELAVDERGVDAMPGRGRCCECLRASQAVIPRREMGRPEEIASVALFLASDDSSYVNGMELVVDGGTTVI
jgi:NAD(P)-dependent dehydrogenase (short-subunit alcohol dehydrogenase family)